MNILIKMGAWKFLKNSAVYGEKETAKKLKENAYSSVLQKYKI